MEEREITQEYVNSLTKEELIEEMKTWSASQWQQYLCPEGVMTIEEFRELGHKMIDEEYDRLGWE